MFDKWCGMLWIITLSFSSPYASLPIITLHLYLNKLLITFRTLSVRIWEFPVTCSVFLFFLKLFYWTNCIDLILSYGYGLLISARWWHKLCLFNKNSCSHLSNVHPTRAGVLCLRLTDYLRERPQYVRLKLTPLSIVLTHHMGLLCGILY